MSKGDLVDKANGPGGTALEVEKAPRYEHLTGPAQRRGDGAYLYVWERMVTASELFLVSGLELEVAGAD